MFRIRIARRLALLQPLDDGAGLLADAALGIDHQRHHVGILGALPGRGDHGALEPPLGDAEDARRVDQHDLRAVAVRQIRHGDADHPHAGGLHLGRDDADLGADQRVDQGRLAGIGRADDGDEAGAVGHVHVPQPFEQRRRRQPLGLALAAGAAAARLLALDRDIDHEHRRMRRPLAADLAIGGQRQAARLRPFLQRRLGVARRGQAGAQPLAPQALDARRGDGEAGIEEDRAQHRLAGVGQDGRPHGRRSALRIAQR